jgi:endonuclease/exonuclease/phosphatase family metal-dependent hydrolase
MMARLVLLLFAALLAPTALHAEPVELRVMTFNVWYGGEQVDLATVAAEIRAADADVVGLQEVDGNLDTIAELAGYSHIDPRRRILSRYPIFDSGTGRRETDTEVPYSIAGLDPGAVHAWVMVRPGEVVAVGNTHLSSDPSGMEAIARGATPDDVRAMEQVRVREAEALRPLGALGGKGVPVVLTGDFNAPSHLDWTPATIAAGRGPYVFEWPVSRLLEQAGLRDSWREAHPDPVTKPGLTWTPGTPHPKLNPAEVLGRIDFIYAAGPVETLASRIVGETGGPDVDIAIAPYPSDHRAVVSTFRVEPVAAPPLISASPRRVTRGESALIRGHDPSGTWSAGIVRRGETAAITGLYHTNEAWRAAARLGTFELEPGDYDAMLFDAANRPQARAGFTVVARDAVPSIAAVDVAAGEPLSVSWQNAPGAARDWIGLYSAGEADLNAYQGFAYTQANVNGQATIDTAALPLGEYEARLLFDEGFEVLAAARFTIGAARSGH